MVVSEAISLLDTGADALSFHAISDTVISAIVVVLAVAVILAEVGSVTILHVLPAPQVGAKAPAMATDAIHRLMTTGLMDVVIT